MKKILCLLLCMALSVSLFVGCAPKDDATTTDSKTTQDDSTTPTDAGLSGKKVAVVRNLASGDHTQQFLAGCVEEGEKMGMEVKTFVTDGDDARCQETVAQVISQDYDAIIVSHAQLSYAYDMLAPAVEKGMKVVTFDSMPYENGDPEAALLEGVTSTAQDDNALATLSLEYMLSEHEAAGKEFPIKVLKTFMGPGVPPLDRRDVVYKELEAAGKIETVITVAPSDFSNARGDMTTKTEAILPTLKEGDVDAIWGCYDELAKGVLQALNDANRTDIPMYTIDVSNDDIQLMTTNPDVWKSTAAVDPKLIGTVNMRLVALKLVGEETPEYFNLDAKNILTTDLKEGNTIDQLTSIIDGWGDANDPEKALYNDTITGLYVK